MVRNKVATGEFRNLPKAARMAKVVWSKELAWIAKLLLSNCESNIHECISSPNFYYIGRIHEQIKIDVDTESATNYSILKKALDGWLLEVKSIPKRTTLRLPFTIEQE